MESIDDSIKKLNYTLTRYNKFKDIFNTFQQNLNHLNNNHFGLNAIELKDINSDKTEITFIDRCYEVSFSLVCVDRVLKGKITFSRILDRHSTNEIAYILHNHESKVEYNIIIKNSTNLVQDEEDIHLNEERFCLQIILDWISYEIGEVRLP